MVFTHVRGSCYRCVRPSSAATSRRAGCISYSPSFVTTVHPPPATCQRGERLVVSPDLPPKREEVARRIQSRPSCCTALGSGTPRRQHWSCESRVCVLCRKVDAELSKSVRSIHRTPLLARAACAEAYTGRGEARTDKPPRPCIMRAGPVDLTVLMRSTLQSTTCIYAGFVRNQRQ